MQKKIRTIVRLGDPVLRLISEQIPKEKIKSNEIQQLIQELKQSMIASKGLGIAAPQIGVSKQICLIEVPQYNQRYGKLNPVPFTVVINPTITVLNNQTQGFWEGCLSIPGIRAYVRRPKYIKVNFLNEQAEEIELQLSNMGAVVFQHEVDHLFGILFIDKYQDKKISFIEEFDKFGLFSSEKVLQ